jgi:CubicO group peptidase (beta-lactamase class C family)
VGVQDRVSLDLDEPARIEEADDNACHRRLRIAERLAVRAAGLRDQLWARDVYARAHDVIERRARFGERLTDDLEAALRLSVCIRRRVCVPGHDRRGPRNPDVPAGDNRARVAEAVLEDRAGRDPPSLHATSIARVDALAQVDDWPAANVAVAVALPDSTGATRGDLNHVFRWASVTKLFTALAALVAAEEGTIDLDEPAGPEGSTVRHLLAHASGLPFEPGAPTSPVGKRRIYSNVGFETLAEHIELRAEIPFPKYLADAVLSPLGMGAELVGSPASGLNGSLADLLELARELQQPRLIAPETLAEATTVQFAGLAGVLPDFGRCDPNDWGLGFELRDDKSPHWTGSKNSVRTFGHFGGSGTFLWVDPEAGLALACLTDLDFGDWAKDAWPRLSDAVLTQAQPGSR